MEPQPLCMDESAEAVIKCYSNMVYRLAFARTGTRHDADEIYQEVFLRYIKKQPVFENEDHRKAWLIKVTVNCSKKLWGSAWKRKIVPLEETLPFETKEAIDLYNELQQLPTKYREVIHLYYYEDMSTEAIAESLERKSSTVRTQLTRARAMLKNILEEDQDV
ncbi:sigma-70 family RNA polymerase sigma factor [Fusibacter paucivorans]|uniref:Sigma-70 family RNA polymerase sigma factor n=1 Tax=Fusibacter paucivorans TaxID=76009 RepID=A0ABS5PSI0_9FIRM|nr:sigma-70 family RNA polymerase sigma factor [Fusibacter paucivorans]MBS7527827.1 sigma-70 family RNA polymerase sigma factor [Fusibacter paucivorans]